MWQKASHAAIAAASLFASLASAIPHGDDHAMNMDMGMGMNSTQKQPESHAAASDDSPMSYFAYGKHSSTIIAHIGLMVLAWCFILPVGKNSSLVLYFSFIFSHD